MPASQPASARVNLQELKARLSKILGPDKESQYFTIFSRFLSHRLSKTELDRQVVLTIGKENVFLHNQLVKAILYNAAVCSSEVAAAAAAAPLPPLPVAAAAILTSPRKNRTGIRKAKETLKRPRLVASHQLDKSSPREDPATNNTTSPSTEDEQQQECTLWNSWSVRPPLGTPFCVGSVGSAQKAAAAAFKRRQLTHSLLGDSIDDEQCLEAADLPDGDGMRRRMEEVAVFEQGLQGVSHDCGHVLNQAVDVYLKQLIGASVEFVQSRRRKDDKPQQQPQLPQQLPQLPQQQPGFQSSTSAAALNGVVWPGSSHSGLGFDLKQLGAAVAGSSGGQISALDFKVAMETNPQLLGENRPLHLERIMMRVFEEQERQRQQQLVRRHQHFHLQQQQQPPQQQLQPLQQQQQPVSLSLPQQQQRLQPLQQQQLQPLQQQQQQLQHQLQQQQHQQQQQQQHHHLHHHHHHHHHQQQQQHQQELHQQHQQQQQHHHHQQQQQQLHQQRQVL